MLNDGDLAHCWQRMKRGFSLAEVAYGKGVTKDELDRAIWDWRGRVSRASRPPPFDPRALRRLVHAPLD